MSQQVIVDRDLEFRGVALYQPNVKGPMMTELKIFDETFFTDADEHDWDEEASNGCTIDHSAVDGGATTLVTGATNKDCGELSHTAQWSPASNCGVEVKMKVSRITNLCICGGFVDAKEDLNDHVAMEISGTTLYAATKANDFAGFAFDTDQDTDVWYVAWSKNGAEGTPVAAAGTLAPVADTYFKIRIQTDSDGNVLYYYNGVCVGRAYTASVGAIAHTATDLLTPYIGCISRTTSALTVTISRITTWQEN